MSAKAMRYYRVFQIQHEYGKLLLVKDELAYLSGYRFARLLALFILALTLVITFSAGSWLPLVGLPVVGLIWLWCELRLRALTASGYSFTLNRNADTISLNERVLAAASEVQVVKVKQTNWRYTVTFAVSLQTPSRSIRLDRTLSPDETLDVSRAVADYLGVKIERKPTFGVR